MTSNPVVPKSAPLTEERFHAVFLQSLARMIATHGESQVALWVGVSGRQLRNIKAGSLPTADKVWNLLAYDQSAHDEMARHYGLKNVAHDTFCMTDPVAAKMAALLVKVIDAEDPNGPGGVEATLHEILDMPEPDLRAVARKLLGWIDRLDEARGPELRLVAGGRG